jgi:hypothetical protein
MRRRCGQCVSEVVASHLNGPNEKTLFINAFSNRWRPGIRPTETLRPDAAGLAQIRHVAATPMELPGLDYTLLSAYFIICILY